MRTTSYIHKGIILPASKALRCLLLIIILNFQFSMLNILCAQTFMDDLRKEMPGQGKVTVTQSKEIDELVNGKPAQVQQTMPNAPKAENAPKTEDASQKPNDDADNPNAEEEKPDSTKKQPITIVEGDETVPPDMRKKVMRRSYKMQGYRVQVFSGGNSRADRQKAETAGVVMKSHFPDQPIYTHFYSPSWKCRMGNFKTQAEAQAYLARVRKLGYSQACIVKGPIQVQY